MFKCNNENGDAFVCRIVVCVNGLQLEMKNITGIYLAYLEFFLLMYAKESDLLSEHPTAEGL